MSDEKAFLERLKTLTPKQTMLLALELQRKVNRQDATRSGGDGAIAICGMGCRFPGGGTGPDDFWDMLIAGRDAVREVPGDRWDVNAWYDPDPGRDDRIACRTGGFLDRVDTFDAALFGLTPREALSMDPQHRLLLETAWSALEDAQIAPDGLKGTRTGVFVGISTNDYGALLNQAKDVPTDSYFLSGNALNFAAGRIAFTLGLEGPAVSVDTACSSSLTAVHLAAQALRAGDCDVAIAGGVNLVLSPLSSLIASRARMLSPTGRCRAFDAGADGMVRGEGCGMVVLQRADGAPGRVRAVLRASAINQNGPSSGITTPSRKAQEAVIRAALARAGLRPRDVGFLETHGTGTALGDPIEAHALGTVFAADGAEVILGATKTNIGHLESAAGIAGLIKTVLSLEHGKVPPILHLQRPNPEIDWDRVPANLPTTVLPLTSSVAGLSSFGGSGTNVHAVIEAKATAPIDSLPGPVILPVSAASAEALAQQCRAMAGAVQSRPACAIARTASVARAHLPLRRAVVAADGAGASAALQAGDLPQVPIFGNRAEARRAGLGFLFDGQGGQYCAMGRALYDREPAYREGFDDLCARFASQLNRPLRDVVFDDDPTDLADTLYAQPAIFTLQMALVRLWAAWGLRPTAVAGHSLGAFAAACVAGVMTLDDAVPLVALRGRLVSRATQPGAMLAIFADPARLEPFLSGALVVSCRNAADETIVTGPPEDISQLEGRLTGLKFRRLAGTYGFHSPLMDPILNDWRAAFAQVELHDPNLPFACTVYGDMAPPGRVNQADYWVNHLRQPVDFHGAIKALSAQGTRRFLEIGPNAVLAALAARASGETEAVCVASLRRAGSDVTDSLTALARLYETGLNPDWAAVQGKGPLTPAPTYRFERTRFWPDILPILPENATQPLPLGLHRLQCCALPAVAPAPDRAWQICGDDPVAQEFKRLSQQRHVTLNAQAPAPDILDLRFLEGGPEQQCALLPDALAQAGAAHARLWVVTRQAGALAGMVRTALLEHSDQMGGLIDLGDGNAADLVRALPHCQGEPHLTFSDGGWGGMRLVALPQSPTGGWHADPKGLYLVTGGLGGLGRHFARWLVERGARRLVLTGRAGLDQAGQAFLADLGAEAEYRRADVADMAEVLAELGQAGLRGVIHAAGIAETAPIADVTADGIARQFAAKVAGADLIADAMRRCDADLVLFCSSASAVWGSKGLSVYGAANAHLNALAETLAQEGLPALSIAWGPWKNTGLNDDAATQWFARAGVRAIDPAAALEMTTAVVGQMRGCVTVSDVDWPRFRAVYEARRSWPLLSQLPGPVAEEPLAETVAAQVPRDSAAISAFLRRAIARVRGLAETPGNDLAALDLDSLMVMDLLAACKAALGVNLYPKDFYDHSDLENFAAYLAKEAQRAAPGIVRPLSQAPRPDAVFLLSSPRSGSTLFRVMLAGHPKLFCPPELHLLPYETMADWRDDLRRNYLDEGLIRAVMERFGDTADKARARVDQWADAKLAPRSVYDELSGVGQVIVDKSPSYGSDMATLARAERMFERPLYIHLTRHPIAVVESILRNRMDRLMGDSQIGETADPLDQAQALWLLQNRNLLRFLQEIPNDRRLRVSYEDLVTTPEPIMRRVLDFIGVGFHPDVLRPYAGARMTDGVHGSSLTIGDPNFQSHTTIDADLGQAWKHIVLPRPLGAAAAGLAREIGYVMPQEPVDATLQDEARQRADALRAAPQAQGARDRLRNFGLGVGLWKELRLGWSPDGGLCIARENASGAISGFAPFDGPAAAGDMPLGLATARDAIQSEGYAIVLPDAVQLALARRDGLKVALGGPLSDAGRNEATALGAMVFDLSGADGTLTAIGTGLEHTGAPFPGDFALLDLHSAALGQTARVAVYTPPGGADLPLILVLPGAEAVLNARLAAVPARLIASGAMAAVRIAWVQAPRSLYLDPPAGGPKWESFIADELPQLLNAPATALVGLSMGGLGVLRAGLRRPGQFSALCALAPALEAALNHGDVAPGHPLAWLRPKGFLQGLYGSDIAATWTQHHPPAIAMAHGAALRTHQSGLALYCGDGDSLAWDGSLFLHQVLEQQGIAHDFHRREGARHDSSFFGAAFPEALIFSAEKLVEGAKL
ncbi:SDR family NAD(P)-dependent oxidoreductase [Roseovarius aestuarii]|nr:SDR family NAD(P)-dependent oxidoreductase [Roseovarius aestuarii]